MASINSYASSSPVIATDKWIGTSGADNSTKNFTAAAVSAFSNPKDVFTTALTNYSLLLRDANCTIVFTGAGIGTWTIPTFASIAYDTGTLILVCNSTAFALTLVPDTGVTANSASLVIAAGDSKWCKKISTNEWQVF